MNDFEYIRTMVRDRSAICLDREQSYLAEARLDALARREGLGSVEKLILKARGESPVGGGLRQRMVEAMTTNESYFFRDVQPFEALRKVILPGLIARRGQTRELRIWCAACSSGQEPYSIALLLREHFGPQLSSWEVSILATDISTEILTKAREGRYTQMEVNRGVPAAMLVHSFYKVGSEWHLKDEIRRMVTFQHFNLIDPWPRLGPIDLLMLRNVLIYFDPSVKRSLLDRASRVLAADGHLFLGAAETTLNLSDAYERVDIERAACYRLRKNSTS